MDMEELMDLLVKDESPSQISDAIKDQLFSRSASKIEDIRPNVAASIFDNDINFDVEDTSDEVSQDVDLDSEETE
jgi:hypothetical protein